MAQSEMPLQTQKNVKPRLLDQVRQTIRRKHYSLRTEATYIDWIKRYIFFHRKRHPKEMRKPNEQDHGHWRGDGGEGRQGRIEGQSGPKSGTRAAGASGYVGVKVKQTP